MTTLFVSDLHLSGERPDKLDLFRRFLSGPARRAEALYILGDLVEVWAGDDDPTPPLPWLRDQLRQYTGAGGRLFVMRGNRDFLMGARFCRETGATLLPDPSVIRLQNRPVLIMHGDRLCTRDTGYQRYRKLVDTPAIQRAFLGLPVRLRTGLAHGLRSFLRRFSRNKAPVITDVEQASVEAVMRAHAVALLIHGHTHRPAIHDFTLDGRPARRIVLGDWYAQDSVLISDKHGERLLRIGDIL